MALQAPISNHLDLYRYWLAKRGSRSMPARRDINPADIPALLPYLVIVEKIDHIRYRLAGTAVVREVGHELTGSFAGSVLSTIGSAAAEHPVYERAFTTGRPAFATGVFKIESGSAHNVSLLVLPLSDDGTNVNMALASLIARFNFDVPSTELKGGLSVAARDMANVDNAEELETRCLEWERYCDDQHRAHTT